MVDKSKRIINILKGSIISILITMGLILIASVIFSFTNVPERIIPIVIILITSISIFIGSIISSKNNAKMGIINGALVGVVYLFTIYLLSSIIFCGFSFNLKSLIMILFSILLGIVGGIIGVNLNKK